jgi:hypothetical protein
MKGFCVITNQDDIVVSISMIPGLVQVYEAWHVYFPAEGDAVEGQFYKEDDNE